MKIWVHLNGQQQGPYEFDDLKNLPITPQTPVWYDGLMQWTVAGVAPATAVLFQQQPQPNQPQQPQPNQPQPQPNPANPANQPNSANSANQPQQPNQPNPAQWQQFQQFQQWQQWQAGQPQWQSAPKRPATFIVWNALVLIFFCSLFGLIGLICGIISSSRYDAGDYQGAKSMSTAAAWFLVIGIALCFITIPLGILLALACAPF